MSLKSTFEALAAQGAAADRAQARAAYDELKTALEAGTVRSAEPDAASPTGWRVNTWVKQGILLGFRFGDLVDQSAGLPFSDKDTQSVQQFAKDRNIRIVPGGSAIRGGAHIARGVICVPPMYVNIGAYIGEGTLIDSHALVGSCAQIGARVHVSAAAQIGGVLEPVGAMPVIVKYRDDKTDAMTELEQCIRYIRSRSLDNSSTSNQPPAMKQRLRNSWPTTFARGVIRCWSSRWNPSA
jgi:2,3,4,5-tetrahydropyridine-2-carboxylate N-succinyltransferase